MLFIREQVIMIFYIYTFFVCVMSNSTYSSVQHERNIDEFELHNMAEDICTYNPCKNGGTCSREGNTFKCTCEGTWTGKTCETDPCYSNPCKNGGKCKVSRYSFECECPYTFGGERCEIDLCYPNPCENGGKCIVSRNRLVCICPDTTRGVKCEIKTTKTTETTFEPSRITVKENFTETTPHNFTTRWPSTLSTKMPEINLCISTPCKNGGICVQVKSSFSCFCRPPYFGVVCEKVPCMENPCQNGGTCIPVGYSFKCQCKDPYSGDTCQYDVCHDNPCFNGGTCQRNGNYFKCKCRYGYIGIICEKEGYQSFSEEISTTKSLGNFTNENYNETENFTVKPGICTEDSDCLNGGICSNNTCECLPNYGGYWCERNILCERLQPTCHVMGADCKIIGVKAICDCPSAKMYDPQSGVCEDICNPWRCLHGRCEIDGRTYKCICDTGYKGHRCSESVQVISDRSNVWLYIMICMVVLISLLLIQQIWMFFRYRKLETNASDAVVMELNSTEPRETTTV